MLHWQRFYIPIRHFESHTDTNYTNLTIFPKTPSVHLVYSSRYKVGGATVYIVRHFVQRSPTSKNQIEKFSIGKSPRSVAKNKLIARLSVSFWCDFTLVETPVIIHIERVYS